MTTNKDTIRIEEHLDEILKAADDHAQIDESTFKQYILPVLAAREGEVKDISFWLSISGNWQRPIDVLDDINRSHLFTIPGLTGSIEIPEIQDPKDSASEIIANARRKMAYIPKAGEEYLERKLSDRLTPKMELSKNRKVWNDIYTRYGIKNPLQSDTERPATTETPVNTKPVNYDDL